MRKLLQAPVGLLPVQIKHLGRFVLTKNQELVEACSIISNNGTVIGTNLTKEYAEYLEKLINMKELEYDAVRQAMEKDIVKSRVLLEITFPRQPLQRRDQKTIIDAGGGRFIFKPTQAYTERRKLLMAKHGYKVKSRPHLFPFREDIEIECIFYINKNHNDYDKQGYTLTSLISTTMEFLIYLKIIPNESIVQNVDGSRIVYTDKEPHTDITIRKVSS